MKEQLKKAIEEESEQELIKCLAFGQTNKIEPNCYEYIEKALLGNWHSQHEDLVSTIYLGNLIDERFVDPILTISLDRERYRWYDDEMESTLRKCVHALKTINSARSNIALEKLVNLNNDNVKAVLELYK